MKTTITLRDHLIAADAPEAQFVAILREHAARRTARRIQRLRDERKEVK